MPCGPQIPLCRSEWLQDVSIELGRRFVPKHPFKSFAAQLDVFQYEAEEFERLSVWAAMPCGTLVNLALWSHRVIWVSVMLEATHNNSEYWIGFYPRCVGFGSERVAEAFRETVALSTRLCDSESPLPTLRRVWDHQGEVKINGTLKKPTL